MANDADPDLKPPSATSYLCLDPFQSPFLRKLRGNKDKHVDTNLKGILVYHTMEELQTIDPKTVWAQLFKANDVVS